MEALKMKKRTTLIISCLLLIVIIAAIIIVPFIQDEIMIRRLDIIAIKIRSDQELNRNDIKLINKALRSSKISHYALPANYLIVAYHKRIINDITSFYPSLADYVDGILLKKEIDDDKFFHIELLLREISTKKAGDLLRKLYHHQWQILHNRNERYHPFGRIITIDTFPDSLERGGYFYPNITESRCACDPDAAISAFSPLLDHDVPIIRYRAANILGWFKDYRAIPVLKEAIENLYPIISAGYRQEGNERWLFNDTLKVFCDAIKRIKEISRDEEAALMLIEIANDTLTQVGCNWIAAEALIDLNFSLETISKTEYDYYILYRYKTTINNKDYYFNRRWPY